MRTMFQIQQTHMQHQFGVGVDQLDQGEKEELVTACVQLCGFLFELKAGGHPVLKRQTLSQGETESYFLEELAI